MSAASGRRIVMGFVLGGLVVGIAILHALIVWGYIDQWGGITR